MIKEKDLYETIRNDLKALPQDLLAIDRVISCNVSEGINKLTVVALLMDCSIVIRDLYFSSTWMTVSKQDNVYSLDWSLTDVGQAFVGYPSEALERFYKWFRRISRMNKSIEFVKQRILTNNTGLELKVLDNSYEMSFIDAAQQSLDEKVYEAIRQNKYLKLVLSINDKEADFNVKYDPDAEFEYFTMESCVCDGTFMFLSDNIAKIIEKVLYMKTYNTNTLPFNYVENCDKYKTTYTVGNLVICSEHGEYGIDDWVPEDKRWMRTRWTVMLPIKTEYELKGEANEN